HCFMMHPCPAARSKLSGIFRTFISLLFFLTATKLSANNLATGLIDQLAAAITNTSLTVGTGNFLYQDTPQQSAFSVQLGMQVENAVAQTPKFSLVTRDHL